MILKSLFAAAAIAAAVTVAAPAPEARADIDVDIGIGVGGFYPGYYGSGYVYDYGYGHGYGDGYGYGYRPHRDVISCNKGRRIVDRSGFNRVRAIDCSLPGYRYTAWKNGRQFVVRVNGRGDIVNVRRVH